MSVTIDWSAARRRVVGEEHEFVTLANSWARYPPPAPRPILLDLVIACADAFGPMAVEQELTQ